MNHSAYGTPFHIRPDKTVEQLHAIPLAGRTDHSFNEEWLQRLLYEHPESLPIAEIDSSFSGLIPLCIEMDTPAGPVDAVFITPSGRLALLEVKLWRNPEARRKVVGQILDYAKELPSWDYSRLDAAVRQARKNQRTSSAEPFPGIAEMVARQILGTIPHRFQDGVTKSLAKGEFLLLIAGDGIREGIGAITQFLDRNGSLHFTFGLIECAVYTAPTGGIYVHPRVLAKTLTIPRTVYIQSGTSARPEAGEIERDEVDDEPEATERRSRYKEFWREFIDSLHVDDAQQISAPGASTNQYFRYPGNLCWISAYLLQSQGRIGVYLRFAKSDQAQRLHDLLLQERTGIDAALGLKTQWETTNGVHWVFVTQNVPGEFLGEARSRVQKWLVDHTERFLAVFGSRILRFTKEEGI